jgi:quinone-modifying oxidoreductase subunit QmoC
MGAQANPDVLMELKKFGAADATVCFNCGNCTAVCELSSETNPFPRKVIRYLQLGLVDKLLQSPDPWMCYYCGDCSQTCPRQANPGEVMMGIRRYLTSRYDWTGISRRFYTSKRFELLSILIVAALVGLGFYLFHGPMLTDRVALNVFAPNRIVEILDLILLAVLSLLLLSNAWRMIRGVMKSNAPYAPQDMPIELHTTPGTIFGIPAAHYIQEAKEFVVQFVTQKKFASCGTQSQRIQWIVHLLIMTGYSTVFFLVVVGIRWFQRDEIYPLWNPVRLLGYYSTFAILYGVTYAMVGRFKKSKPVYEHTHTSDWVFLIMLWLTAFSGILVHMTRLLELPLTTYYIYVIHLMIAVPMLVIEVPFAKWTHQLYRPLILFLMKVKQRAAQAEA